MEEMEEMEEMYDKVEETDPELEGINHTYFASIHKELCLIEEHAWWADPVLPQLQFYKMDIRLLERFCRAYEVSMPHLSTHRLRCIWRKEETELAACLSEIRGGYLTDWDQLDWQLRRELEESKLVIEEWCEEWSLTHEPPQSDQIPILLDVVLNNLKDLLSNKVGITVPPNDQIEALEENLVYLQIFLKLNAKCSNNKDFQELETCIHLFANNAAFQTFLYWVKEADEDDATQMDLMVSDLFLRIKPCMPDTMASYFPTLKYKPSTSDDIARYFDAILDSLKDLFSYKVGKIVRLKKQIETLEQKLVFLQNFLKLAATCANSKEFKKFLISVHGFSENAASLTILYWIKAGDEEIASKMILMLSDMLQKIEPCTPDVIALYFGTFKEMKLQRSDTPLLGQTVVSFVDLLLENVLTAPLKDDFEALREELIFVITFLADPLIENANDDELTSVLKQIDVLLRGARHRSWYRSWHRGSSFVDMKKVFSKRKVGNFQRDIETVNAKIRRLYCEFRYSLSYAFPKIIGQGFLDLLIRNVINLEEKLISGTKCVSFAKNTIWKIEVQLVSLRPLFNDILELQVYQKELRDTWLQFIKLVHLTEHVFSSCFDFDYPIWYHMAHLHDVLNRIKDVKTKLETIKECNAYNVGVLPYLDASISILSKQGGASDTTQLMVGFEEEANTIIEELTWGHKSLDIVSIVGMAGLGKTTLARKVYGAPSVKSHFHIFAFCIVSRDHNAKRLLHDILSCLIVIDEVSSMTEDDLAHQLWKCLSGRKYLIVLDDIWEIRVWNEVKRSFPDDQNGSRVVFTTRFNKVAVEAQIKCSPYHLGFLSDEKSWELLKNRVFLDGSCSPKFSDVGKLIAKNCKGLPLSVVVIAGVLAKTEPTEPILSWWSEIAERTGSFLLEEGCMDMLEFSYKHLPEYLKPLLLYFGAFPEDTLISVKSLMLLWIDEGFVHESKTKRLEDVAKDYLHDLVDRSLIIVTGRSSNGGVKTVGIHDLIHDFCRIKARAENFFQLRCGIASSSSSHNPIYNHYRVCMQMAGESMVDAAPTYPCVHSLLFLQRQNNPFDTSSILGKFKLVQVLHLDNMWLERNDLEQISLLVHLRHILALVMNLISVPSSISNLCALETFILRTMGKGEIVLPKTIWNLKWLRHVNISRCRIIFPSGHDHEVYSQLNNVDSFSSPTLTTGKHLEDLLQRLPAVRKLSCSFNESCNSVDQRVETLDFLGKLESLNLSYIGDRSPYVINFPSTLKKLKLVGFKLPWTAISDIVKLERLEVLKLLWNSFVGPRWEMEDLVFPSLKFLKLNGLNLVHWNAVPDSFPCLEQLLVIGCEDLVEIPVCFGEVSTLKRFEVHDCNKKAASSATQVQNEQMELGNNTLEAAITNSY